MANNTTKSGSTKKTETKATKPVVEKNTESSAVDETAELRKQLEEMKAQMQALMQANYVTPVVSNTKEQERQIKFVNMTNGALVLRGTRLWRIDEQFGERTFSNKEALVILNNMGTCISNGLVYIADADFVEDNGLSETYKYLLSDSELKELLNKDSKTVVDIYKNVSDGQKEIIIEMISQKILHGTSVDANVLVELGKLSGQDLIGLEPLDE